MLKKIHFKFRVFIYVITKPYRWVKRLLWLLAMLIRARRTDRQFKNAMLTDLGVDFVNYLKSKQAGSDEYNHTFEEILLRISNKMGVKRANLVNFLVAQMENMPTGK